MKYSSVLRLKETKFANVELEKVQLDGLFSGYASLFDKVDLGNDMIMRGAFKRSLATRQPADIKMLYQHDPNMPIGVWLTIEEDRQGLRVKGRIASKLPRAQEVLELIRCGAIDGLSIGFKTIRARKDPIEKCRKILEADLWEISIVTFPMQQGAKVDDVPNGKCLRITEETRPSLREFERWLMRDAGLSRRDARVVIHKGYANLANRQDAVGSSRINELAAEIRRSAAQLSKGAING